MKESICLIVVFLLLLASLIAPLSTRAEGTSRSVTGVVQGTLPSGTILASVAVNQLEIATGVFIEPDGTAAGTFSAVLVGHSFLGDTQEVTIDGKVLQGVVDANGRPSFSGIARLDLGNGVAALTGIPFNVETTTEGVVLTIEATSLQSTLTGGSLTIE
jgi:hypothetical protein